MVLLYIREHTISAYRFNIQEEYVKLGHIIFYDRARYARNFSNISYNMLKVCRKNFLNDIRCCLTIQYYVVLPL